MKGLSTIWLGLMIIISLSLAACNPEILHASAPIRIKDPWLRWQPETNSGELYFYLVNKSPVDDTLIEALSEAATTIEFYNNPPGEALADTAQVPVIELPVESGIILMPGGPHLKLIGLTDVTPGQLVPITLKFEQAGEFSFYVEAH